MTSSNISSLAESLNKTFELRETNLKWRKQQLNALKQALVTNEQSFLDSHYKDLRQTKFLSKFEFNICVSEIDHALKNIDSWIKPQKKRLPLLQQPGSGQTIAFVSTSVSLDRFNLSSALTQKINLFSYSCPRGVVLIIGPWNYPFQLVLLPLIGAIAAGNCVVIKPSEMAPNVSKWISKHLKRYLDTRRIVVVEGGVHETTLLLKQKWDYIFYTGNPSVGKIVMQAASAHLTPVTLELGGKSPVIVDENVELSIVCKRLVMAKFLNMGQTCVAPDYVFVHKNIQNEFIEMMQKVIFEFYGLDPQKSPHLSRIINRHHVLRLQSMLKHEKKSFEVILGGKVDENDLYVSPTLVLIRDTKSKCSLITNEIFGPILPIIPYQKIEKVVRTINKQGQPLALYIYSNNNQTIDFVVDHTRSGSVSINESLVHASCRELPFGGTGSSGFGRYYGKYTFDTFSHERSILKRSLWKDPSIRFPPHNEYTVSLITHLQHYTTPSLRRVSLWFSAGMASFIITKNPLLLSKLAKSLGFMTSKL